MTFLTTIFGQSAGSQSVFVDGISATDSSTSDRSVGIMPESDSIRDLDRRERGSRLVEQLAVGNIEELRVADLQRAVAAAETGWGAMSRIVIDGDILQEPHVDIGVVVRQECR